MKSKELLYVEDALGHENFMKSCSCETSKQLQDQNLVDFVKDIIGIVPLEYEFIYYLGALFLFVMIIYSIASVFSIVTDLFK